jgi:hypothetical protein
MSPSIATDTEVHRDGRGPVATGGFPPDRVP